MLGEGWYSLTACTNFNAAFLSDDLLFLAAGADSSDRALSVEDLGLDDADGVAVAAVARCGCCLFCSEATMYAAATDDILIFGCVEEFLIGGC